MKLKKFCFGCATGCAIGKGEVPKVSDQERRGHCDAITNERAAIAAILYILVYDTQN